jgi:mannose-6-phosphate isomerase-like protein (cupin superfamily)
MTDDKLIEELHHRFHSAPEEKYSDRIANLEIIDLRFANADGTPFGNVRHLVRGDDKSGAAFDIFRLGWSGGRLWELVVIDGAYLPHVHRKIGSEFVIFAGSGHLSRDTEWRAYHEKDRVRVPMGTAHGFVTDPAAGPTVFLSLQSDAIRKITIDPKTHTEKSEDDFVYVDDTFPLPPDLCEMRRRKLAARRRRVVEPA